MLKATNYRLYTFINFYLSSIQQGIQSAHIVSDMMVKYRYKSDPDGWVNWAASYNALWQWAEKDKTIIVLNGGTSFDIRQTYIDVKNLSANCKSFAIPFAFFQEDHNALGIYENGVVTGFGMVVPQQMWDAKEYPLNQNKINQTGDYFPFAVEYFYDDVDGQITFLADAPETKLIKLIRTFQLAR